MNTAPQVFNRARYLARQQAANAEKQVAILSTLYTRLAEDLQDRLALIKREFEKCLLLSANAPYFAEGLRASGKCKDIELRLPQTSENLSLPPAAYDAAISLLDLQTINDVPGYMAQFARALKPDGLALFVFFAGDSLHELREAWLAAEQQVTGGASPRVAPMIDLREAGGLLQRAGLALPVADVDRVTLRYADALSLMREVKMAGFSNCMLGRRPGLTAPGLVVQAAHSYPRDEDGRISATVDLAWAMAWKPHPSQQRPLKPGSAKQRLADALNPQEKP